MTGTMGNYLRDFLTWFLWICTENSKEAYGEQTPRGNIAALLSYMHVQPMPHALVDLSGCWATQSRGWC